MDRLGDESLDLLFCEARTQNAWLAKPVADDLLRRLYDLAKWGPTSATGCTRTRAIGSPMALPAWRHAAQPRHR